MPGLNQSGPAGQGPMTGRRMGRCTNYGANQKNQNSASSDSQTENNSENYPFPGFGLGRGRGGRGLGLWFQNRFKRGF